jgi:HAD superfamily hydrolase (TIGR01509 family)
MPFIPTPLFEAALLKAVLWDVDGTLIATKDLYLECYRRALAPYAGRRLTDDELLAMRPHSELQVLKGLSGAAYQECIDSFRRHYSELHATHFGGVYDGVRETLGRLRELGIRNGIVTGKSRSSWDITLAEIELGDFDVVVVDDDVAEPKPDPEGILAALAALDVRAGEAIYVGDSPGDMRAARAAGTRGAAAMWSKNEAQRMRMLHMLDDDPHITLLESPADVLTLVTS